ncbi:MAG TPA: hypothetical protein PKC49_00355 [Phycisphaerae bacterium]|nr:hypothetical protein [Phycisphaerae bacterium]
MRIAGLLVLSLALLGAGCAASGWSPAEVWERPSEVTLPGIGTYVLGGPRDTSIQVTGLDGSHTQNVPSAASITITRSASAPINALAAGQQAIEAQRQQTLLAVVAELRGAALDLKAAILELRAAPPAPADGESRLERRLRVIEERLGASGG